MGALTETILTRLLDQQKDGENWVKLLTIIADEFEEVIEALVSLSAETWIATAQGVWVDRIGEIVGVGRPPEEEVDNVFTVCEADDEPVEDALHGWGDIDHATEGGYVWDLYGLVLDDLATDETYLDFIAAKIAATNADASVPGLAQYVLDTFGIEVEVVVPQAGVVVIILPETGYDLRQRRYLELFCPAAAGIDVLFMGWPEV